MKNVRDIIKGLNCCKLYNKLNCDKCPYDYNGRGNWKSECTAELATDALTLLKEQEPVKPHYNARTNWYECGACHYSMTSGMHCRSELIPATKVRYCANCGFPVNWEGR